MNVIILFNAHQNKMVLSILIWYFKNQVLTKNLVEFLSEILMGKNLNVLLQAQCTVPFIIKITNVNFDEVTNYLQFVKNSPSELHVV